jgi:hypothetical protein
MALHPTRRHVSYVTPQSTRKQLADPRDGRRSPTMPAGADHGRTMRAKQLM